MFQTIIDKLNDLLFEAQCNTLEFHLEDYKWELGKRVINELESHLFLIRDENRYECVSSVYGIPVEVNNENYDVIKLWKEIKTND